MEIIENNSSKSCANCSLEKVCIVKATFVNFFSQQTYLLCDIENVKRKGAFLRKPADVELYGKKYIQTKFEEINNQVSLAELCDHYSGKTKIS